MTLNEIKNLPRVIGDATLMDEYHNFIIDKHNTMSERMEALFVYGDLLDPGENESVSAFDVAKYTECFVEG